MKRTVLITIIMFTVLIFSACNDVGSQNNVARTHYESLNLETPESAVREFTDAFKEKDFYTVFYVLSPSAQLQVESNMNSIYYPNLMKVDDLSQVKEILSDAPQYQTMDNWEHLGATTIYLFDGLMLAAESHSAYLIDLSRNVSILRSETFGNSKINVYTIVEGIEGEVIFRMEQAPSGRWRVLQVIVPNGNEQSIPWSVPTN